MVAGCAASSSMASSSTLATNAASTFFFSAENCPAPELAQAISEHWAVSVLVHGDEAHRLVTGRLIARNLTDAVESLSFLLGCRYRKLGAAIYLVGGKSEKVVNVFPSYGLADRDWKAVLGQGVAGVGDRMVV